MIARHLGFQISSLSGSFVPPAPPRRPVVPFVTLTAVSLPVPLALSGEDSLPAKYHVVRGAEGNPGPLRPPTSQAGLWPGRLDRTPLVWSGQHPGALQATCSCWRTLLSVLCVGLLFSPQASSEGHLPERPPHSSTPIYSSSQRPFSGDHIPSTSAPHWRPQGQRPRWPGLLGAHWLPGPGGSGLQRGETGLASAAL